MTGKKTVLLFRHEGKLLAQFWDRIRNRYKKLILEIFEIFSIQKQSPEIAKFRVTSQPLGFADFRTLAKFDQISPNSIT